MKIAVFGLGYVGITGAACMAHEGHEILGVDVSEEKVSTVNAGKSPIAEPGLADMIGAAVAKRLLHATKDPRSELASCEMAIVCVGTPSAPDGSHNMSYIAEVTQQIAGMIAPDRKDPLTVVYRSTMRPGSMEEMIAPIFAAKAKGGADAVELVYNPEFLRESSAVEDYFHPPKIVVGTKNAAGCERLARLNANIEAPVFNVNYREAELTKFVDNTFHAVKITFANEIGRVCRQLGLDASVVHKIFVSDTKLNISPYYFRPGGAFGGSCLPKDVRALQYIAGEAGAHTHLVNALMQSNDAHKHFLFELCRKHLGTKGKVLMLGLSFKADSDDLRESPNIDLARKLLRDGHELYIYDPNIVPAKLIGQNLGYAYSNLPTFQRLLVSKDFAETQTFDLAVDTRGWAKKMKLHAQHVVDVNSL